jgi:hypothetical protein
MYKIVCLILSFSFDFRKLDPGLIGGILINPNWRLLEKWEGLKEFTEF